MGETRTKRPSISSLKKGMSKLHIKAMQEHIKKLENTIDFIKKDPHGVLAPVIEKMAITIEQNQRLTALVALILEDQGPLEFPVDRIEGLQGNKIDITFDLSQDKKFAMFKLIKEKIEEKTDPSTLTVATTEPQPEEALP